MNFSPATLSDLPEFRIGNAQDEDAATGCTVIVSIEGATCSVDVRGGGPATRETDLLKPENMVEAVHAVVLSGGSAFGLEASTGVMQELARRGVGFELCGMHVPIVVGACLFDLPYGKPEHPTAEMGISACRSALDSENGTLSKVPTDDDSHHIHASATPSEKRNALRLEGNVGAGCGATVGKMLDPSQATKSGLGIYGLRCGDLVTVAIVAVNALGTVCLPDGTPLAGHRNEDGIIDPLDPVLRTMTNTIADGEITAAQDANGTSKTNDDPALRENAKCRATDSLSHDSNAPAPFCTNTTIGVVLTNANLTKAQCQKTSSIVHDAYARAIRPVHTSADGDAIFTIASGRQDAPLDLVAIMATEAMQMAILRAVATAEPACGLPALCSLQPEQCEKILKGLP